MQKSEKDQNGVTTTGLNRGRHLLMQEDFI